MEICFKKLTFTVVGGCIRLARFGAFATSNAKPFAAVHVCGENKPRGGKLIHASECENLRYVSHTLTDDCLTIVQKSELVEVKTVLQGYSDTDAVSVYTEVKNLSAEELVLEEVSAFVVGCLGENSVEASKQLHYYRFFQSHHTECQPRRQSFYEYGMHKASGEMQKRISYSNVGSWSTKEELPQGIIENAATEDVLLFQLESNNAWCYEISDHGGEYYLHLGGANLTHGGWSKALKSGESYRTIRVALAFGKSVEEVVGEITKYRRHIAGKNAFDAHLPAIFNEYMHLSWDSPTAEQTAKIAPIVAKTGVEYYVIDCGWHNEEPGNIIYPYVGQWKESKARFPEGVRKTTDFIRSLGMKAGLWIELEIIGVQCTEMLDYYTDDCFLQRNGKKIAVMGRYFLDFRNAKVRAYLTETIRRMVEDYGADYIKLDYNQDCGAGTDYLAFCASEGLEQAAKAYLAWAQEMQERFPAVLFETCSSGGMRMDYATLSHFSLISTSDQVDYLKYPYIVGNILSAVLPEQAAVWSYPIDTDVIGLPFTHDEAWVKENVSDEKIVVNMINSFLGRMHLASHLELFTPHQLSLVQEGVAYYQSLVGAKKKSLPYFPKGFTRFGEEQVVAGFKTENKIYLAVWCLGENTLVEIPIKEGVRACKVAYPIVTDAKLTVENSGVKVAFSSQKQAVFLELEIGY